MASAQDKYEFIRNKTCPYCQSKIKTGADFIVCSQCGTPHHTECWDENSGCTTYGCINNPNTEEKVDLNSEDIGHQTIDSIRESLRANTGDAPEETFIECPNCKSTIEESATYCKICGYNVKDNKFDEAKEEFEKEFKKRYKEKQNLTRNRFYLTIGSFTVIILTLAFLFYLTVTRLNEYFTSDEYKIINTVENWKEAWENKNPEKYKSYLSDDYLYFGKDGKEVDLNERLKRIESAFKNSKEIKIKFSDMKIIEDSSTTSNDKKIQFGQIYEADKIKENGVKTLRLYKGEETNGEWKIYREFLD
ncbi:MAG: RING finger protein [bacterium]